MKHIFSERSPISTSSDNSTLITDIKQTNSGIIKLKTLVRYTINQPLYHTGSLKKISPTLLLATRHYGDKTTRVFYTESPLLHTNLENFFDATQYSLTNAHLSSVIKNTDPYKTPFQRLIQKCKNLYQAFLDLT